MTRSENNKLIVANALEVKEYCNSEMNEAVGTGAHARLQITRLIDLFSSTSVRASLEFVQVRTIKKEDYLYGVMKK